MLESIQFKNFKALRDTTLPLQPLTLIVGPNGSGKSSALQAIRYAAIPDRNALSMEFTLDKVASRPFDERIQSTWPSLDFVFSQLDIVRHISFDTDQSPRNSLRNKTGQKSSDKGVIAESDVQLQQSRIYALDAARIAMPAPLDPQGKLKEDGYGLVVVLDQLRDNEPERFEEVNRRIAEWLPEFDRILFDTTISRSVFGDTGGFGSATQGGRLLALRVVATGAKIQADQLSQGTLLALAMLTLAYLPSPPPLIGLEEPDRGIHPRLLRDVKDALERLAYPDRFGESRKPVQVIATTHSPYFLDLFRDEPECVVIAEKQGSEATFRRLIDIPNYEEILQDSHLGDAWYSGILGGVPAER